MAHVVAAAAGGFAQDEAVPPQPEVAIHATVSFDQSVRNME